MKKNSSFFYSLSDIWHFTHLTSGDLFLAPFNDVLNWQKLVTPSLRNRRKKMQNMLCTPVMREIFKIPLSLFKCELFLMRIFISGVEGMFPKRGACLVMEPRDLHETKHARDTTGKTRRNVHVTQLTGNENLLFICLPVCMSITKAWGQQKQKERRGSDSWQGLAWCSDSVSTSPGQSSMCFDSRKCAELQATVWILLESWLS